MFEEKEQFNIMVAKFILNVIQPEGFGITPKQAREIIQLRFDNKITHTNAIKLYKIAKEMNISKGIII